MLLADSGFYFHLSRLVGSPDEYQYMQALLVLNIDLTLFNPKPYRDLRTLPKLLGLPSLVSYVDIKEFVVALYESSYDLVPFFETFQRDPARSAVLHHNPARWHAFVATRFLRFLATASSREIFEFSYIIHRIPGHIMNAKPGDKDLLTEIQRIESLPKPLIDKLVTSSLELVVVKWLQVSSYSFLQAK